MSDKIASLLFFTFVAAVTAVFVVIAVASVHFAIKYW